MYYVCKWETLTPQRTGRVALATIILFRIYLTFRRKFLHVKSSVRECVCVWSSAEPEVAAKEEKGRLPIIFWLPLFFASAGSDGIRGLHGERLVSSHTMYYCMVRVMGSQE